MTNQRLNPQWIIGFVDGEGCFNVDVHIHRDMRYGIQIQTEFCIVQHERDIDLLYRLKNQFGCGTVAVNRRDATSVRYHWRVKNIQHAVNIIIPFFEKHKLITKKNIEFQRWRDICLKMGEGYHLQSLDNFLEIVEKGNDLRYFHYNSDSEFVKKESKKRENINTQLAYLKQLKQKGILCSSSLWSTKGQNELPPGVPKMSPQLQIPNSSNNP